MQIHSLYNYSEIGYATKQTDDIDVKVVPNTLTKINLARLIFIKFWQNIYFDP